MFWLALVLHVLALILDSIGTECTGTVIGWHCYWLLRHGCWLALYDIGTSCDGAGIGCSITGTGWNGSYCTCTGFTIITVNMMALLLAVQTLVINGTHAG